MNRFDLTGRVVLLTGATGYLGSAMAYAILDAGADLILTGRREKTLATQRELLSPELRERCHISACDVTHTDTPAYLKSLIEKRFGGLHGIVNSAYAGRVGTLDAIDAADFITACTYNLVAPFALVKALAPLLEETAKKSRTTVSVVNVASMYGIVSPDPSIYADSGLNNPVHYGASKSGMIQLSRYLACHLGQAGIRVNSISPGPFPNTEVDSDIPEFYEKLARKVPMGRVGRAEEVAGPVVFLLSNAASYVNGANLSIDGGWTAW
jgi:NAD(P)-dependent dehydrogenase (short-subunit alcohol dehydrogenase family)